MFDFNSIKTTFFSLKNRNWEHEAFCTHQNFQLWGTTVHCSTSFWPYTLSYRSEKVRLGPVGVELLCMCTVQCSIQTPAYPDPGPASQLSVPQAEIKVPVLANPPRLRHSLAPAAAKQEQPQHALLRLGRKELKDSWAGCVINTLHDWCPTWHDQ